MGSSPSNNGQVSGGGNHQTLTDYKVQEKEMKIQILEEEKKLFELKMRRMEEEQRMMKAELEEQRRLMGLIEQQKTAMVSMEEQKSLMAEILADN